MKTNHTLRTLVLPAMLLATLFHQPATSFAQGTAFSYQGRLDDDSVPANGIYNLRFAIFDALTAGNQVGAAVTNSLVNVSNGLFTTTVDLGPNTFSGLALWLDIGVRTNGGSAFTPLNPRQPVTPTPYAIYSGKAMMLDGALPDGQLSGAYSNALTFNNPSNIFTGKFTGNGAGLSNLNAAQLSGIISLQNTNSGAFTNDDITVHRGWICLPSAGWASEAENTWGGRLIWDFLGGSRYYDQDGVAQPMGLIGAWNRWGATADNPWMMITCGNLRLEEGFSYGSGYSGEIHIGNEDHFGSVQVNYTPVLNGGAVSFNTLGRGHPLAFQTAYTIGSGGYLFSTPGIQSVAGGPGLSYGPGGNQRTLGELWFFSGIPIPNSANVSNVWDAYPGTVTAKMKTNSWDFVTPVQGVRFATTNVGVDPYRGFSVSNGIVEVNAFNTTTNGGHVPVVGIPPGYYMRRQDDGSRVGFIGMWDDHASAALTPEMIIQSHGNIALIQGFDRENANVQLGRNQYPSGWANLGHAGYGINDGLAHLTQPGWGHGQRLVFPSTTIDGTYAYSGIQSLNAGSNAVYNGYGLGELLFYTAVPIWTVGAGFSNAPGILTMRMKTNALEVLGDGFIGNTRYLTNWQYAVFSEQYASAASPRIIPSATYTNVLFTTNNGNFDGSAAFTLSNSFLIVTTNGAGRWRVRGNVVFHNDTDSSGSGAVQCRLRRHNNSATTLAVGSAGYQYNFVQANSTLAAVVTLTAGDLIGLQAFATTSANTSVGTLISSGDEFTCATIEFERQ